MQNKKERVCIYIDGGNFHHLVIKKLKIQEISFLFDHFVDFLANSRNIVGKRFYIGSVREQQNNPRSKVAMAKQTKFFNMLKITKWHIKTSKLRIRTEKVIIDSRTKNYKKLLAQGVKYIEYERMREKGIDVKLATDLIVGAVDDQYDTAILVSSDADLVPTIDWIRRRYHKKIEYIGFSILANKEDATRPLQTMIAYSDIQRILVESDLQEFVKIK